MECREVQERLSAWLDEEVPEALGRRLEDHLASCARCREEWQALAQLEGLLASLRAPAPPPDIAPRVLARLRQRRRPAAWWKSLALAASVILGVFLGNTLTGQIYPKGNGEEVLAMEMLEDFPQGSLGAVFATYPGEEGNGA